MEENTFTKNFNTINSVSDEKSFLLASFGKIDDVKRRIDELEKQIEVCTLLHVIACISSSNR